VTAGEVLAGRYVVIEKVDHRGMGIVYKALDRRREQAGMRMPWVALKFARPTVGNDTITTACLRQEFLKLSQLKHPNIVSVFDFDSDAGLDFIVMEWLEGQTLAHMLMHITSNRIALYKAEEIARGVGSALAHAHERGVVHGDIKPSNIFLTHDKTVKLLDFGSSGAASTEGENEANWATRAYASCEVLRGDAPQPHDDVFALGVTAYCVLSGERPFGELDAAEAKAQGVLPLPLPPDAEGSWPAIEHALQLDASERPADAGAFLVDLADAPIEAAEAIERSQLQHIAYGAVAAALLIALVAWTAGSTGGISSHEQVLLDEAESAFAAGRLVEPGEGSAFALFTSVLEMSPANRSASDGLQRITEYYLGRAREALAADDPEFASDMLATARQVMPGHYGIAITSDLIARYGTDLLARARDAAGGDPQRAELLLNRAAAFLPSDDPGLAALESELDRLRAEAKLEALLQAIDARILAERLAVPRGDSALDLLREARELAPDDRQVMLAADRIATALLFQSMFAISSGELDDAQRYIDGAKALNVKHLALSRAEYELAKARHEALKSRAAGSD
jgi:tetratricopeptide (TPR) repeat protein